VHAHTARLAERAADGILEIARELGIPMTMARFGSVFVPYFYDGPTVRYEDLLANDTARDVWFRRTMAERGVFMVPTALKRNHVSAAHTDADIDRTLDLAREVLRELPV
jgi:glutamate-1-semialdehyde 2,1-aminomutase